MEEPEERENERLAQEALKNKFPKEEKIVNPVPPGICMAITLLAPIGIAVGHVLEIEILKAWCIAIYTIIVFLITGIGLHKTEFGENIITLAYTSMLGGLFFPIIFLGILIAAIPYAMCMAMVAVVLPFWIVITAAKWLKKRRVRLAVNRRKSFIIKGGIAF